MQLVLRRKPRFRGATAEDAAVLLSALQLDAETATPARRARQNTGEHRFGVQACGVLRKMFTLDYIPNSVQDISHRRGEYGISTVVLG